MEEMKTAISDYWLNYLKDDFAATVSQSGISYADAWQMEFEGTGVRDPCTVFGTYHSQDDCIPCIRSCIMSRMTVYCTSACRCDWTDTFVLRMLW